MWKWRKKDAKMITFLLPMLTWGKRERKKKKFISVEMDEGCQAFDWRVGKKKEEFDLK